MVEAATNLFLVLSALFPIVDPPGGSPIFLSLTKQYTRDSRRRLSLRVAINSFFLLLGSFFVGSHILAFFGVSLAVVQIGGGLIVISTGWALLKQRYDDRAGRKENAQPQDPFRDAFYPLTLPLTVGPGSISVAIALGANAAHRGVMNIPAIVAGIVGAAILAISVFLCYGFSDWLAKLLGATAMSVIMQLSSFLLVCIGVQILWKGANALLSSTSLCLH